jgi:hypothetical protein
MAGPEGAGHLICILHLKQTTLMSVSRSEWNTALRKMQSFEIAFAGVCGMFFALE